MCSVGRGARAYDYLGKKPPDHHLTRQGNVFGAWRQKPHRLNPPGKNQGNKKIRPVRGSGPVGGLLPLPGKGGGGAGGAPRTNICKGGLGGGGGAARNKQIKRSARGGFSDRIKNRGLSRTKLIFYCAQMRNVKQTKFEILRIRNLNYLLGDVAGNLMGITKIENWKPICLELLF